MTLSAEEFMRRFLLHVLPRGFHRIRHHGLLANGVRKVSLALIRELMGQAGVVPITSEGNNNDMRRDVPCFVCAHCGASMIILQTFTRGQSIRAPPVPACLP